MVLNATRKPGVAASPTEVAAAVITSGDLILACRRREEGPHAGKWEFPGGKREEAETLEQCLRRELIEELGIDADVGAELWHTTYTYPGQRTVRIAFFRVPRYRGSPSNLIFADIAWVRRGDLGHLDFLEADREFVEQLDRGKVKLV
jgi:8-oxo-dGTP diphosphatase